MIQRRGVLAAMPGLLALGSGCTGILSGSGLTLEAKPAKIESSAADDAGYEFQGVEDVGVKRTFAGQSVKAVNKVATYEKSLSIPLLGSAKLGVVAAISTPAVEVAGKTFNPVGDYDNDQLVALLQSNYEGISDAKKVGSTGITVLDSDTSATKYDAKATFNGQQVDVTIYVAKVRHESDFVVLFGVYPTRLDEQSNVLSMMQAAVHPA